MMHIGIRHGVGLLCTDCQHAEVYDRSISASVNHLAVHEGDYELSVTPCHTEAFLLSLIFRAIACPVMPPNTRPRCATSAIGSDMAYSRHSSMTGHGGPISLSGVLLVPLMMPVQRVMRCLSVQPPSSGSAKKAGLLSQAASFCQSRLRLRTVGPMGLPTCLFIIRRSRECCPFRWR